MEPRDRRFSLALFAAAAVAWLVVGVVALTLDPRTSPQVGFIGSSALGVACGLTAAPLAWLIAFAAHRRIAYRGDWTRAIRRGAWVGGLVAIFALMRLNGVFQPPIALFVAAMALVAEVTLSQR